VSIISLNDEAAKHCSHGRNPEDVSDLELSMLELLSSYTRMHFTPTKLKL
jgi:hypothetical protein